MMVMEPPLERVRNKKDSPSVSWEPTEVRRTDPIMRKSAVLPLGPSLLTERALAFSFLPSSSREDFLECVIV